MAPLSATFTKADGTIERRCQHCKAIKPLAEFTAHRKCYLGKAYYCLSCKREYMNSRYVKGSKSLAGPDGYESLKAEQGGCCAICKDQESDYRALSVDHCHSSGKVRGLLCTRCNFGLGYFKDNPQLLEAAIGYLRGHKTDDSK